MEENDRTACFCRMYLTLLFAAILIFACPKTARAANGVLTGCVGETITVANKGDTVKVSNKNLVKIKEGSAHIQLKLLYAGFVRVTVKHNGKTAASTLSIKESDKKFTGSIIEKNGYYFIEWKKFKYKKVKGEFDSERESATIKAVNTYRKKNGLSSLKKDSKLMKAARIRAIEVSKVFEHRRPNGLSFASIYVNLHGENLADGFSTGEKVVNAWALSPSHNANLLSSAVKKIGIGVFWTEKDGKTLPFTVFLSGI